MATRKTPEERTTTFIKKFALEDNDDNYARIHNYFTCWMASLTPSDRSWPSDGQQAQLFNMLAHNTSTDLFALRQQLANVNTHSIAWFDLMYNGNGETEYQQYCDRHKIKKHNTVAKRLAAFKKCSSIDLTILSTSTLAELDEVFMSSTKSISQLNIPILDDLCMFNPIGMAATYSKLTAHTFRGLSYFTLRFGQHGAEHYNNELTQRSEAAGNNFKNTYQYWLNRGLSETESQQAVSTEQSRRSLLRDRSLEHSTRTHAHWVAKGYTDTDATEIVHNIQSRAASFFVEKYGTDQGMLRYKKMIDDRVNTYYKKDDATRSKINQSRGRTYQQLADTHGAAAASNIISRRTSLMHGFSEEANKFFYQLDQILTDDQREQSYTAYKTNEWFVRHNDGILFVDYKLENVIIEYNGSFWHGDSRIFADNDIHPVTKQPIAEMQDRDRRKTKILENKQFHVLSIWSLDSQADIQTQLKKCKDFINDYL